MLNFVLCEDNQSILDKLTKMLESIFIKNNLHGKISCAVTAPDELINYIEKERFDVVILDIDLKSEISGISLANLIRKNNKKAYIIFATAHLEYSLLAYKYKTFDFLPKPVTLERLEETILRLFDDATAKCGNFFKLRNKNCLINNDDVFFIQKQGKTAIFKTSVEDISYNSSFSNILNHLPNNFVRCHKSYIVNLDKISCIQSNNTIVFKDNSEIQCFIGPKYEYLFAEVKNHGNFAKRMENFDY